MQVLVGNSGKKHENTQLLDHRFTVISGSAPSIFWCSQMFDVGHGEDNIPFCGESYLAHVRYGTDSENSIDRCHPVTRESNWMTSALESY